MTAVDLRTRLRGIAGLKLWSQAPLALFTTIGVGGPAQLLAAAATPEAVAAALACLAESEEPWSLLGAGSNLLVADAGFPGVILKLGEELQYVVGPQPADRGDETALVEVGAATPLPRLSSLAVEWGLSGLEFACAIPGSVGGAVLMNAGAHGVELASVVEAVQVASADGVTWVPAADFTWGYRSCSIPAGCAVTATRMRLTQDDAKAVRTRQRKFLQWRRENQPRGVHTFGSTFKNPPGDSAGRLLDAAGLKGASRGGAEVSRVHANFIVNRGDATAHDVVALMTMMREAVYLRFGVLLEPEVRVLGMALPWDRSRT